ncbi:MAG: hypothetical protein M3P83_10015, partial [Actinomycetota bacterium]|nr:hypothetical protein [Actinomycetota bacterium]
MTSPRSTLTTGAWRLLRGSAVGAAAVALALGGHVASGGGTPPLLVAGALAGLTGAVTVTASAGRW